MKNKNHGTEIEKLYGVTVCKVKFQSLEDIIASINEPLSEQRTETLTYDQLRDKRGN